MTRALRALAAALLCVVTLLVAACGGSSGHQSATGSVAPKGWGTPPQTAPTVTATIGPLFTMYDSVTIAEIPGGAFADAGYTSGLFPTYLPLRARISKAHTISIAIDARHHADCLDVEPGDAVPSQAAGWVRADERAGFRKPCVYSSWWEYVHEVRPDLAAAGIARSSIFEWDADYTNVSHIDTSFDATQWTSHCRGRNLDCSLVTAKFLAIASPAYNPTPPKPKWWSPPTSKLDRKVRTLYGVRMSERSTVENWVQARCVNPARRRSCRTWHHHAAEEKARLDFVARHGKGPKYRKLKHPNWSKGKPGSLGERNQILQHVLTMKHGSPS